VKNPIGANTWIWVSPLTDERLAALARRVRGFGFDVIELPIENLGDWDPGRARDLLDRLGLHATTCAVMSPDRDLVSDDRAVIESTQAYIRGATDMAAAVGADVFTGGENVADGREGACGGHRPVGREPPTARRLRR